ncbi:MAG: alcohol dehydrogenase catalytic domain-containing protein, partial [Spirochaetales bacterium]|nr:alcohol dehydrogenase catalytic domain-containing protein [Spirochaetales bacterium]
MIAAYLERAGKLSLREVDTPDYASDEVLVRVYATGICGSDLHYFRDGRIKNNIITEPLILGHESSGTVAGLGSDVTHLREGDRVTIEPGVPCLKCEHCLSGRYNLCVNVMFLGAPPSHGSFREFISHKALFVHKLPENASFEDGACIEPLAVG